MAMFVSMRYAKAGLAPSISPAQRNLDRPALFDAGRLRHAAQRGDGVLQALAGRKDRDDVAEPRDLEIDVGIGIGELGRNPNGLAVARFEHARPRHRLWSCGKAFALGLKANPGAGARQSLYIPSNSMCRGSGAVPADGHLTLPALTRRVPPSPHAPPARAERGSFGRPLRTKS